MVKEQDKAILTAGLLHGYGSKVPPEKIDRSGFNGKSTNYSGPEGSYHDEWFASISGGGQELATTPDGDKITRLYGGGTVPEEILSRLGITAGVVGGKLVEFIGTLGNKTRFDKPARARDGKWGYEYSILESRPEVPVEVAKEKITYDGQMVFIHYHIFTQVK